MRGNSGGASRSCWESKPPPLQSGATGSARVPSANSSTERSTVKQLVSSGRSDARENAATGFQGWLKGSECLGELTRAWRKLARRGRQPKNARARQPAWRALPRCGRGRHQPSRHAPPKARFFCGLRDVTGGHWSETRLVSGGKGALWMENGDSTERTCRGRGALQPETEFRARAALFARYA